jgi:hypothetical protein
MSHSVMMKANVAASRLLFGVDSIKVKREVKSIPVVHYHGVRPNQ